MSESPVAIERQINANFQELDEQWKRLNRERPASSLRPRIKKRIQILDNANYQWNLKYKRLTGKPYIQTVARMTIEGNDPADLKAKRDAKERGRKVRNGTETAAMSLFRLRGMLRDAANANESMTAGFVNMFTFTYWAEPKMIAMQVLPPIEKALAAARYHSSSGQTAAAKVNLQKALDLLDVGFNRLLAYNQKLEVGCGRAIAAIKVVKDAAIALASGGMSLNPVAGAGIEAISTGSEEAALLGLAAVTGDQKVGWHDVGNATKNVVIDTGMHLAFNKLGGRAASGLGKKYEWSKATTDVVAGLMENYMKGVWKEVAAKVEAQCRGKSKQHKVNFIAAFIAPGIKSIPLPGMGTLGTTVAEADLQAMAVDLAGGK